jgi:hypothetical protein
MPTRGRPRLPEGQRKIDARVNVSMNAEDAKEINTIREKLALQFGFTPTISQAIQWLVASGERVLDEANSKKVGRKRA